MAGGYILGLLVHNASNTESTCTLPTPASASIARSLAAPAMGATPSLV